MPDVLTLTLGGIRAATPTTRILEAELGDTPFHFRAGQGVTMGVHGDPVRHPYSIACAPTDVRQSGRLEFLISVDGTGHEWTPLGRLRPGVKLDVEGPWGSFVLPDVLDASRRLLFVGGGTGIAPLRSMIREALARRHPAPLTLVYSARTAAELSYLRELRRLARRGLLRVVPTVTRERSRRWRGERGRITRPLIERLVQNPTPPLADARRRVQGPSGGHGRDVIAFLCGPPTFVSDLARIVRLAGVAGDSIHTEHWHE